MRAAAPTIALLAATMLPGTAPARPRAAAAPTTITVSMAGRSFSPQIIRLRRGTTYVLRLVNPDRTEHDFYAPEFLDTSRIPPADAALLHDDRLDVPGGTTRTIRVTPQTAAPFDLKSTKALDVASGMQGQILVY